MLPYVRYGSKCQTYFKSTIFQSYLHRTRCANIFSFSVISRTGISPVLAHHWIRCWFTTPEALRGSLVTAPKRPGNPRLQLLFPRGPREILLFPPFQARGHSGGMSAVVTSLQFLQIFETFHPIKTLNIANDPCIKY